MLNCVYVLLSDLAKLGWSGSDALGCGGEGATKDLFAPAGGEPSVSGEGAKESDWVRGVLGLGE